MNFTNGMYRNIDDNISRAAHSVNAEVSRKAEFVSGLRHCDQAISDLLHHIELSKGVPCDELTDDIRLLRKYLRRRRKFKNRLELIQVSNDCNVGSMKKCVRAQTYRKYTPKVLKGLIFSNR